MRKQSEVNVKVKLKVKVRSKSKKLQYLEAGPVAKWLATCARKPKVPGSDPAASYAQL